MAWLAKPPLPIWQLGHEGDLTNDKIHGIVTVIWPYSSSKQQMSIIIADKDVNLRKNGQARIIFHGHSAKSVADAGIFNGDELFLSLHGAQRSVSTQVETGNKEIEYRLHFNGRLLLAIWRDGSNAKGSPIIIDVNRASPTAKVGIPLKSMSAELLNVEVDPEAEQVDESLNEALSSRLSGSMTTLQLLSQSQSIDDDELLANHDRQPKRTRFGRRSSQWRFANQTPSPPLEHATLSPTSPMSYYDLIGVAERPEQRIEQVDVSGISNSTHGINYESYAGPLRNTDPVINETQHTATGGSVLTLSGEAESFPHEGITAFEASIVEAPGDSVQTITTECLHPLNTFAPEQYFHEQSLDAWANQSSELLNPSSVDDFVQHIVHRPFDNFGPEPSESDFVTILDSTQTMPRSLSTPAVDVRDILEPMVHEEDRARSIDLHLRHRSSNTMTSSEREINAINNSLGATLDQPIEIIDIESDSHSEQSQPIDHEDDKIDEINDLDVLNALPPGTRNRQDADAGARSREDKEYHRNFYNEGAYDDSREIESSSAESSASRPRIHRPPRSSESLPVVDHREIREKTDEEDESEHGSEAEDEDSIEEDVNIDSGEEDEHRRDHDEGDEDESSSNAEYLTSADRIQGQETEENQHLCLPDHERYQEQNEVSDNEEEILAGAISSEETDKELTKAKRFRPKERPRHQDSDGEPAYQNDDLSNEPDLALDGAADSKQDLHQGRLDPAPALTPRSSNLAPHEEEHPQDPFGEGLEAVQQLATPEATQNCPTQIPEGSTGGYQEGVILDLVASRRLVITHTSQENQTHRFESQEALDEAKAKPRKEDQQLRCSTIDPAQGSMAKIYTPANKPFKRDENRPEVAVLHNVNVTSTEHAKPDEFEFQFRNKDSKAKNSKDMATDLQIRLSGGISASFEGFRTPLSYFVTLDFLARFFNCFVDVFVLAVSTSRMKKAANGPRDHYMTIAVKDPWMKDDTSFVNAQIFRPFQNALPQVKPGDALLLREFKVQSRKRKLMLLSSESSAWAVFPSKEEKCWMSQGPPVEIGSSELKIANDLRKWWNAFNKEDKPSEGSSDR